MVLKKIKSMRGALYRKFKKEGKISQKPKTKKETKPLPGFQIKKPPRLIEFPPLEDITKIDIVYPLLEPFVYANIKWDPSTSKLLYSVVEPELSEGDKKLLNRLSEALIELIDVGLSTVKDEGKAMEYLQKQISKILKESELSLSKELYIKILYYVYRDFVGFNEINAFFDDPNIEDISCDGVDTPIYIVHRKFGSLKTNIAFDDLEKLREFIIKLSERSGRYVSYAEPILDGTLPDGSRVSATLAGDVATRGPTFTIRKFSERPFSPVDQIKLKTANPELLAYMWYLIENASSMLIVGGVATGKTSLLNSLCMFIPPEAKIVSIEDTRELRIPNEHWVPTLARSGFGIPLPSGEKYGGVSLFDLLKESFRQSPDYVIVGETRGKEAFVMFQGMSSGHPSMSTFHAGSIDTVIKRLTSPPIELSPTLIESLSSVVVMARPREKGKSERRVKEVMEIESVDPRTGEVKRNLVFRWNPITDEIEKINDSVIVRKIVASKGGELSEALSDIEMREAALKWMAKNDISDYLEVSKVINMYYKEPERLTRFVRGEIPISELSRSFKQPTRPILAKSQYIAPKPVKHVIAVQPKEKPARAEADLEEDEAGIESERETVQRLQEEMESGRVQSELRAKKPKAVAKPVMHQVEVESGSRFEQKMHGGEVTEKMELKVPVRRHTSSQKSGKWTTIPELFGFKFLDEED